MAIAAEQTTQEQAWEKQLDAGRLEQVKQARLSARRDAYGPDPFRQKPTTFSQAASTVSSVIRREEFPKQRESLAARANAYGRIRAARKGERNPGLKAEAEVFARRGYKRIWQGAQEVLEDAALSFTDLFLLTGPATVLVYLGRWLFGNFMGGAGQITVPGVGRDSNGISVPRVPGYEFGDPLDHLRHAKFLLVGFFTAIVYGLLLLLFAFIADPIGFSSWGLSTFYEILKTGFTGILNFISGGSS